MQYVPSVSFRSPCESRMPSWPTGYTCGKCFGRTDWLSSIPTPAGTLPVWQVTFSALTLVGVTAVVLVFRRKRYLPVGWFWFLGTLIPVIGLVQVGEAAMADRYAYIPLIGIFVMIAWSLGDWAEAQEVRTVWRIIPALCALTALATVTYRQIELLGERIRLVVAHFGGDRAECTCRCRRWEPLS